MLLNISMVDVRISAISSVLLPIIIPGKDNPTRRFVITYRLSRIVELHPCGKFGLTPRRISRTAETAIQMGTELVSCLEHQQQVKRKHHSILPAQF